MKKKIFYLLIAGIVIIGGCTGQQKITEEDLSMEKDLAITVDGQDREIIERSETISDIVVDIYGIDDATTIIFNDMAIIGVKIAYDQKLTDDIKNTIIDIVKEKDPYINQVKVTQKNSVFNQIDHIISELLNGKAYDSFVKEIDKIQNKIK